ncbi:unnamed protein product [Anisakis simplex]|uniref:Piwi domain-containing protein n=1 Tax=Anisakis simplex TaxID=6269 RepID=A0A0M3JBU5_ANISI|nr:unnamed protein product [Anisakis simplex]
MKLVEATEQIVTQDVKTSTAMNALEKRQTLDNIVNKTNLKLGGIIFGFRLESERAQKCIMDPGRFIIGVDVVHPSKSKNKENLVPSVVGVSLFIYTVKIMMSVDMRLRV